MKVITTDVDYVHINQSILSHTTPSPEYIKLAQQGEYNMKIYKLIKMELLHIIDDGGVTFETVKSYTIDQLDQLIPHIVEKDAYIDTNILVPCQIIFLNNKRMKAKYGEQESNIVCSHCSGKKLIVPETFREFLELLQFEMNMPHNDFVNSNVRNMYIDMLQFESWPGEKTYVEEIMNE